MKHCILMGSPRGKGNTASLLKPFLKELTNLKEKYEVISLYNMEIKPCLACRACQEDWESFSCKQKDDAQKIVDLILKSDSIIFATPIYSWYCTAPMKALMDRLVYGLNKYYGEEKGPTLWQGKLVSAIITCGYEPEKGADIFIEGLRRYCKHSGLVWNKSIVERHMGYSTSFMDSEKEENIKLFAEKLASKDKY